MKTDELLALFKRRGVLWPSAEIYGGAAGLFDYGPAGFGLKSRLEESWTAWFVGLSPNYYRIDPAEIVPEAVVRASGHLENFADLEVACGKCGQHTRADTLLEDHGVTGVEGMAAEEMGRRIQEMKLPCPRCGERALSVPRPFNLMFGLDFGAAGRERAYLRPETAQSAYLSFARMWEIGRKQLPLGIAIVGKAYRNEIAPRNALYRMRAFTQAELQIFFDPDDFPVPLASVQDDPLPCLRAGDRAKGATEVTPVTPRELVEKGGVPAFYAYHLAITFRFFRDVLRYPAQRLRFLEKNAQERAFYNRIHFDVEAELDSLGGFREVGAVHYRGDYDLTKHGEGSKTDLQVTTAQGKSLLPHVLELTFGVDRNVWALGDLHLRPEAPTPAAPTSGESEEGGGGPRTVWALPAYLSPTQVVVLPLIRKAHSDQAESVADGLRREGFVVNVAVTASLGKRYAREDEMGTPFAVTIDEKTASEGTVTLRERDSREQKRLAPRDLPMALRPALVPPRVPH